MIKIFKRNYTIQALVILFSLISLPAIAQSIPGLPALNITEQIQKCYTTVTNVTFVYIKCKGLDLDEIL